MGLPKTPLRPEGKRHASPTTLFGDICHSLRPAAWTWDSISSKGFHGYHASWPVMQMM